jgi:hypothetical protein
MWMGHYNENLLFGSEPKFLEFYSGALTITIGIGNNRQ